nr:uncharacterized protein LOC109183623 [Ipomoea batatas]
MWGNFTVCQGVEIDKELQSVDYPVVLGRRITVTPYQETENEKDGFDFQKLPKKLDTPTFAVEFRCQTQDRGGLTAAYTVASICEDISTSSITGLLTLFSSDSRRPQLRLPLPPTSLRSDFDDFSLSITKVCSVARRKQKMRTTTIARGWRAERIRRRWRRAARKRRHGGGGGGSGVKDIIMAVVKRSRDPSTPNLGLMTSLRAGEWTYLKGDMLNDNPHLRRPLRPPLRLRCQEPHRPPLRQHRALDLFLATEIL